MIPFSSQDPHNKNANESREQMAAECLEGLITWLKEGGNVGIHGQFEFKLCDPAALRIFPSETLNLRCYQQYQSAKR